MAFEEGTETLVCAHCGASHKAKWYRLPVREEYSIHCQACRKTLKEGKGVRDYFDVKLTKV
jgi:NMD protein affecting ribosome stability and mRNA decay